MKPVGKPDAGNPHVRLMSGVGKRDDARRQHPRPTSTLPPVYFKNPLHPDVHFFKWCRYGTRRGLNVAPAGLAAGVLQECASPRCSLLQMVPVWCHRGLNEATGLTGGAAPAAHPAGGRWRPHTAGDCLSAGSLWRRSPAEPPSTESSPSCAPPLAWLQPRAMPAPRSSGVPRRTRVSELHKLGGMPARPAISSSSAPMVFTEPPAQHGKRIPEYRIFAIRAQLHV